MRILFISLIMLSACSFAEKGLIMVKSDFTVEQTTQRLVKILSDKNMTIFNQIDHSQNAKNAGMELAETRLVIFGNPKMGTKLIQCAPSVAIDLPIKFLISKDSTEQVWISYNAPQYLVERHQLKGCEKVIHKITGALAKFSEKAATQEK